MSTEQPLFNIDDPSWDPHEKVAYLTNLLNHGVPAMQMNRGKLLDYRGQDRSDLIPVPAGEGLSPMLGELEAQTAEKLRNLIEEAHKNIPSE